MATLQTTLVHATVLVRLGTLIHLNEERLRKKVFALENIWSQSYFKKFVFHKCITPIKSKILYYHYVHSGNNTLPWN